MVLWSEYFKPAYSDRTPVPQHPDRSPIRTARHKLFTRRCIYGSPIVVYNCIAFRSEFAEGVYRRSGMRPVHKNAPKQRGLCPVL